MIDIVLAPPKKIVLVNPWRLFKASQSSDASRPIIGLHYPRGGILFCQARATSLSHTHAGIHTTHTHTQRKRDFHRRPCFFFWLVETARDTHNTHGTRFSLKLSGPRFFGTHKRCVLSCVNVSSVRAFKGTKIESYDFLSHDQKSGGKSPRGLKHYRDVPITG